MGLSTYIRLRAEAKKNAETKEKLRMNETKSQEVKNNVNAQKKNDSAKNTNETSEQKTVRRTAKSQ